MNTQTTAKPSVGFASILGGLLAVLAAAGALAAALQGNDTVAITAAAAGTATAITTLGGRFAQAVVLIQRAAPKVEALSAGIVASSPPVTVNIPPAPSAGIDPATHVAALAAQIAASSSSSSSSASLEDPLLDDPDADDEEPELTDEDLAGRREASEEVGHGDADMRDDFDKAGAEADDEEPTA